ncbi:GNAT family N-acetyltransferase [Psychrobacillus glaciei]|uniref:GNAT family N-acetyltransferase n=1 Tax=Psychrobacillus glaciei TaxID=2283160 RepID=A0A5J6SQA4_9BACI|nr:GNAT family N-acetyltransferase [Psychrobacillus glaciei]QFF98974.1 GNAT family N-acetyltransferase [Psychrobacillus glaciei]
MKIRLATSNDQQQMVNVLNKATLGLQAKGIYQWDYPWDINKIVTEIKNNYAYVLLLDEDIVGTFCIKDIDALSELTIDSKSNYLSQIAILPEYQGNNYGSEVTDFACSFAKEGNKTMYLDCWAGNKKLIDFYLNHGFEYLGDFPEEDYFISIFIFN